MYDIVCRMMPRLYDEKKEGVCRDSHAAISPGSWGHSVSFGHCLRWLWSVGQELLELRYI